MVADSTRQGGGKGGKERVESGCGKGAMTRAWLHVCIHIFPLVWAFGI